MAIQDVTCASFHSSSVLLRYTVREVADAMATSPSPSARRLKIRDLLQKHGGSSTRRLKTKRTLLQHLHQAYDQEDCRCLLAFFWLVGDNDHEFQQ